MALLAVVFNPANREWPYRPARVHNVDQARFFAQTGYYLMVHGEDTVLGHALNARQDLQRFNQR